MNSTKFVSRLLLAALVCAACAARGAAQHRPAEASARKVSAESGAPRALWKDVRVEFEGNRLFTSERLRALTSECYGAGNAEEEFDPERLDYCLRTNVLGFVRRSGYLRAELGEPRVEKAGAGQTWTVPIDEKELYRLGQVKLEGAEFFTPERLREMLPLKSGDIADGGAVVRWLNEHLKKLYADEGFIQYEYDVEPEFSLDTDTGEGVADFSVTVNEGSRFRLRRLTFKGRGGVPEETLRGAMLVKEGEVFNARKFADSVHGINQLSLFHLIDADRDAEFSADEETAELDIVIRMEAASWETNAAGTVESTRPAAPVNEARPWKPGLKVRRPQTREE